MRSRSGQFFIALALAAVACWGMSAKPVAAQSGTQKRMIRVVWQDREDKTLKWGELVRVGRTLQFRNFGVLKDFPQLDKERHELVQMERIGRLMLVGVRDDDKGNLLSGWVALDLRVEELPHGDHSDFDYGGAPRVVASVLNQEQGNPAHLYVYDRAFYLANDSRNGFTRITPQQLAGGADDKHGTFHRGGGGHITLAAVDHKVSYSTWIFSRSQEGGPIDVSDLSKTGDEAIAYTFHLPVGGLHGAIANSGKVFFAPSDGVYWVQADLELKETPETVKYHHISLGKDEESERPNRTGAFTNHRNWVLFTTGRGTNSRLCLLNAEADEPTLHEVNIPLEDGLSLTTPDTFVTAAGKNYAFLFQNKKEGDVVEKLTVIDLDPNRDRDLSDATVVKTIPVGSSQVEGHYGHHTISMDDDGRLAVITNPGDGQIWLLSLADLRVIGKYRVGGMPTKILAIGGEDSKH